MAIITACRFHVSLALPLPQFQGDITTTTEQSNEPRHVVKQDGQRSISGDKQSMLPRKPKQNKVEALKDQPRLRDHSTS
ncbi:hypothetical protein YC2023_000771 [Brassica napus]